MTTPRDIANAPGYGTGQRYRDRLAAEAECAALLPAPALVAPVMASTDLMDGLPIACFGDCKGDWFLVTDRVRVSDCAELAMPSDAESDARTIAAIVNAYRLGVLVRRDAE